MTRERLGASKLTRKSPESACNYIFITSNKHTFLSDITHPQQLHVIIIIILIVPDVQEAVVPHVRLVPANVCHQRIVAVIVLIREMRVRAENRILVPALPKTASEVLDVMAINDPIRS